MIRFVKFQALGNDFIVVDRLNGGAELDSAAVQALCHRRRGIGADGVLTIWPKSECDARIQIQNADGSDSDMCGNGLRCVAAYIHAAGYVSADRDTVVVGAGLEKYKCTRVDSSAYRVGMGKPEKSHADLPRELDEEGGLQIEIDEQRLFINCVMLGNPHAVLFINEEDLLDSATRFGPKIESDPRFRNRVNATFVKTKDAVFEAMTYERGVGLTEACGSAACAVGVVARTRGDCLPNNPITVRFPGGDLSVEVDSDGYVFQTGEVTRVFEGEVGWP